MHSQPEHDPFIRAAFRLADRAVNAGNHPFGALLVHDGQVILEAQNTVVTDRDATRHAEMNVVSAACRRYEKPFLQRCVLYRKSQ